MRRFLLKFFAGILFLAYSNPALSLGCTEARRAQRADNSTKLHTEEKNVITYNEGSSHKSANATFFGKLGFQENKGQMSAGNTPLDFVLFKAEAPGLNIWITNTGITYQFFKIEEKEEKERKFSGFEKHESKKVEWSRTDMVLAEAKIEKKNIVCEGEITNGKISYYKPSCPLGISNIKTYSKILIKEVYKGIDWVIYTSINGGIKYDFIVHPGANPDQIKLVYEGNGNFKVRDDQIQFKNKLGEIKEAKLKCYQSNESDIIVANYKIRENETFMFLGSGITKDDNTEERTNENNFSYEISIRTGTYNKNEVLTIDPQLVWSTIYGGNALDGVTGVTTDALDNMYSVGYTFSSNFPLLTWAGSYNQTNMSGGSDAIIFKFLPNGTLDWATYYGGSSNEWGTSITCDNSGNIFITGITLSSNFPTQIWAGAYNQATLGSGAYSNAFIVKFLSSGIRQWATYFGGNGTDSGNNITTDASGNVFLVGKTTSNIFPILNLPGAYNQNLAGGNGDVFIAKFLPNGSQQWATYYGGNDDEEGSCIETNINGEILVGGATKSSNFPLQNWAGSYNQSTFGGGSYDAFILKFLQNGSCQWATYVGGNDIDEVSAIRTTSLNETYVTGTTYSSNFPLLALAGAYNQSVLGGISDQFLLKLSAAGIRQWATYYGGWGPEVTVTFQNDNLEIDKCGNLYLAVSASGGMPTTISSQACPNYDDDSFNGGWRDIFVAKFSNLGNILWDTYLGGDATDMRPSLAIDNSGNLYVVGEWLDNPNSTTYPFVNPGGSTYFDNTFNGDDDIFFTKFDIGTTYSKTQTSPDNCLCDGVATISLTCGEAPYNYQWSNNVSLLNSSANSHTISGLCSGVYQVTVTSGCGNKRVVSYTLTNQGSNLTINSTVKGNLCSQNTFSLILSSVLNGIPNYTLLEGATTIATNFSVPFTLTAVSAGTHTYTLKSTNGCSQTFTINAVDQSGLNATTIMQLKCFGDSDGIIRVDNFDLTNAPYKVVILNTNSVTSNITSFPINIGGLSAGNYSILVMDVNGCSRTVYASIISPDQLNVLVESANTPCEGQGTTIKSEVSGGVAPYSHNWLPGGEVSNPILLNLSGTTTFTCKVTDSNGCVALGIKTLSVNPSPKVTLSNIRSTNCAPSCIKFNLLQPEDKDFVYGWVFSNHQINSIVITSVAYDPLICFSEPGDYKVAINVTGKNGCITTVEHDSLVSILVKPTADFTFYQDKASGIEPEGQFINLSTNALDYKWYNTDKMFSTETNPKYTFERAMKYLIQLIASNKMCSDTASKYIDVDDDCSIYLPNAFTPSGANINDYFYPVMIGYSDKNYLFEVFDRWGEKIFSTSDINSKGWDGTFKGKQCMDNTYVWKLAATSLKGEKKELTGHVILFRN